VIGVGGTITTTTQALGHDGNFRTFEAYFLNRNLYIATLAHMTIIDTKGGKKGGDWPDSMQN